MSTRPTVSVVIPTYNRAHLVGRAIRSVLAQTFQDFELIVVDDGSTDNTVQVVRSFQDTRIHYLRHEENRGGSAARNTGIRGARGEYIAFLDSDDEWLPQKVERQLEVFSGSEMRNLGIVVCGLHSYRPDGSHKVLVPTLRGQIYEQVISGKFAPLTTATFCVSRKVIDSGILFDEALPSHQDWDFLIRLCQRFEADATSEPLVRRYYLPQRVSTGEPWATGLRMCIHKYEHELKTIPNVLAAHRWTLIMLYYGLRRMSDVRTELKKMIRSDPWHPKWYVWFMVSLGGKYAFGIANRLSHVSGLRRFPFRLAVDGSRSLRRRGVR